LIIPADSQETGGTACEYGDPDVGAALRQARLAAEWTQEALAAAIGCSKSHLCLMESGQRALPLQRARQIEQAMNIGDGWLTWLIQWRAVPAALRAQVRQSVAGTQSLAARLKRALAENRVDELRRVVREAEADEHHVPAKQGSVRGDAAHERQKAIGADESSGMHAGDRMERMPGFGRMIPLINRVAAGYPREFTDLDYPASIADEYVACPAPEVNDPDAFAARVVGDSMEPDYFEGDVVVFSPAGPAVSGCDCFVRLERDAQTTFKRVYVEDDGAKIRLQPLNNAYPPVVLLREDVAGLYAAVWVMRRVRPPR